MRLSNQELNSTFKYLLGRYPAVTNQSQFETVGHLYQVIFGSAEYKSSPRSKKNSLAWPLRQVFISLPSKVIYCPIGKNACSFLKAQMVHMTEDQYLEVILKDVHFITDTVNTGLQLSDYTLAEVNDFITSPEFFKFAVMRDPLDRTLSAYIEKFVLQRTIPGQIVHTSSVIDAVQLQKGINTPDYETGISFKDFVSFIIRQPPELLDPHWRPQHLYLSGMTYDRVFVFKEMDDLIDLLESRSGKILPRKAQNVTNSGVGKTVEGAYNLLPDAIVRFGRIDKESFFTPEIKNQLRKLYSDDFKVLKQLA